MQTLLRYYCVESSFDWTSHLNMVEFDYNSPINGAIAHLALKVMYGYQQFTPPNRLLTVVGAIAFAARRL